MHETVLHETLAAQAQDLADEAVVMQLLKACIPIFTVLSDENRHLILQLLLRNGEMNVNQITENLHLSRPAVSHHLKLMLQANAVSVKQIGKERYYTIAMADEIRKLQQLVEAMTVNCPLSDR